MSSVSTKTGVLRRTALIGLATVVWAMLVARPEAGLLAAEAPAEKKAPPTDQGRVYFVSTEGNDTNAGTSPKLAWRTITHAVKKAKAGDLVRITAGNYGYEKVVIASSGTADAPIRFEGYDGDVILEGKVEKVKGRVRLKGCGVRFTGASHVKLSGITVLKYGAGISVSKGSRYVVVERCTAGICGWNGIGVGGAHHCQVRHCTVYNAGMHNFGVYGGVHNITIADCWSYCDPRLIGIIPGQDTTTDYCYALCNSRDVHITRCRGDGRNRAGHGLEFTAGGGSSGGCRNCTVTECEMYNCWTLFGARHGSGDIAFSNCYAESKIVDAQEGGIKVPPWQRRLSGNPCSHGFYFRTGAHNITVKNCRVRNVRWGLDADNERGRWEKKSGVTRNITFENCIATRCIFGIQAAADNTRVLNCLSARNKYGILIDSVKDISIKNSIICQNETGVRGNEPTARITKCNIWGNGKKLSGKGREFWASGGRCYKDEKELEGKPVSLGAGCIFKDPQFVTVIQGRSWKFDGPDCGNWHLEDTSSCKDMGPYAADPKASIGMR